MSNATIKARAARIRPFATSLGGGRAGLERAADAGCRKAADDGVVDTPDTDIAHSSVRGLASPQRPTGSGKQMIGAEITSPWTRVQRLTRVTE
jgi:hypothetical protein